MHDLPKRCDADQGEPADSLTRSTEIVSRRRGMAKNGERWWTWSRGSMVASLANRRTDRCWNNVSFSFDARRRNSFPNRVWSVHRRFLDDMVRHLRNGTNYRTENSTSRSSPKIEAKLPLLRVDYHEKAQEKYTPLRFDTFRL